MQDINIFLPMNCGSGNRGCEAIAKGTSKVLSLDRARTFLYDFNKEEMETDIKLGLNSVGELRYYASNTLPNLSERAFIKVMNLLGISIFNSNIYPYSKMIDELAEKDLVLLTGGDLYCYEYHLHKNTQFVNLLKKKNKGKIVLWGASIEPKLLNETAIYGLKQLDKITIRESLSYDALLNLGVDVNVELFSDPAFVLDPIPTKLPECFTRSEIVGVNVSNFVNGGFDLHTPFMRNLVRLLKYILKYTELEILLIPHVTWKGQDDRVISKSIGLLFADSNRIHVLNMDDLSYQQIRYIISKCRFFLGGRTHSMISAYSMCIPSMALGYSIKARGIAKDLGLPEELVINCNELNSDSELLNAYLFLTNNETEIKNTLTSKMDDYKNSAYLAKNALKGVLF